jgi:hypothetical protein
LFELSIPLDPKRPALVHTSLAQDEQTTPVDEVPLDPLERDNIDASDDRRDAAWEEVADRDAFAVDPPDVSPEFLSQLTDAALLAQGCDEAWSRLESLGTRNRVSALLPEVSLRAGRERDTALRLTPTEADPFRYAQSDASNTLLEGRLAWRLGRLLFSSEDLGIERLRLARARERQRVVERTLAMLFSWIRAQAELAVPHRRTSRIRAARWQAAQASMRLDAMTAGWFSAHASKLQPAIKRGAAVPAKTTAQPTEVSRVPKGAAPVPPRQESGKPNSAR